MAHVVIGLSGGVDSSVAAYLLKQQGHDVVGLFMVNWHDTTGTLEGDCAWHDDRVFAELVARKLDIPLHVVDLSEDYRTRVVDYMFAEYEKGRTPNPDVLCNREIKFDVFLREALKLGADFVATGHYCRKAAQTLPDGRTVYKLLAGADPNKDQSYFLCQLSQEQLRYALFPVGDLMKPEVRRIAEEQGLATAKRKDSQGICFVGKVDLPVFLQQKLASKKGNIHEILPAWPKYGRSTELPAETATPAPIAGQHPAGNVQAAATPAVAEQHPAENVQAGNVQAENMQAGNMQAAALSDSGSLSLSNQPAKDTAQTACPTGQTGIPAIAPSAANNNGGSAANDTEGSAADNTEGSAANDTGGCAADNTAQTAAAAATGSLADNAPSTGELAALAAPWRYTVRDGKKIGEHNGAHFYTIGQRKGLGIGGRKESLFILATDTVQNVIYVGEGDSHPGLWRPALHIAPGEIHWVNPARALSPGQSARFSVRIRYRQPLQGARLFIRDEGAYILFDTPQRGITPGQFAAWYDGDELVGSGVISE